MYLKPRRFFVALLGLGSLAGPGLAAVSQPDLRCQDCVAGPYEFVREPGRPASDSISFPAFAGPGYEIVVRAWSLSGAGLALTLNGAPLIDVRGRVSDPPDPIPVELSDDNVLDVTLRGGGGRVVVAVRATESASLPGCGPAESRQLFTSPLTPVADLVSWQPLGALSPPGHTLPTHHSYPNPPRVPGGTTAYPIYAPAKVRLVAAEYHPGDDDYSLHIRPCDEVRMYLLHVKRLAPRFESLLGDPGDWSPVPELLPEAEGSIALMSVDVAPGELLGMTGVGERTGYDVGLVDLRRPDLAFVNPLRYEIPEAILPDLDPALIAEVIRQVAPDRLRQHCALDYFETGLADQYRALLGSYDGTTRRSVPPLCGEHMQDLAGSAQGNWFRPTEPGGDPSTAVDETDDFAFVHDNIDPSMPAISLSDRGPVVTDPSFDVVASPVTYPVAAGPVGQINRDPSDMTPGPLYCFDNLSWRGGPLPGLFLMALPDMNSIRVAYLSRAGISCSVLLPVLPPDFELDGPGVVEYER